MNQGFRNALQFAFLVTVVAFGCSAPANRTYTGIDGARELARQGRLSKAEVLLTDWLKTHPDSTQAKRERGCLRVEQGDHQGAINDLKAIERGEPKGDLCLAKALYLATKYDKAIVMLKPLALTGKVDAEGARYAVFSALALRRASEALAISRTARKQFPKDPSIRLIHARALAVNQQLDAALAELEATAKVAPNNPEVPFVHGNILWVTGRYPEAVKEFKEAVKLSPQFAEAWKNMGIALIQDAHHAEAIPALKKALKLVPEDLQALNNLGVALASVGRLEEARALYIKALKIAPGQPVFLNNLVDVNLRSGDIDGALKAVRQLVEAAPERKNAHRMHQDLFALKTLLDHICLGEKSALVKTRKAFVNRGWTKDEAVRALERVLDDPMLSRWIERRAAQCETP